MRKFVANCAPNLHKIAGISFRTSHEGCIKLSHIRKSNSENFMQILLFQCPLLEVSESFEGIEQRERGAAEDWRDGLERTRATTRKCHFFHQSLLQKMLTHTQWWIPNTILHQHAPISILVMASFQSYSWLFFCTVRRALCLEGAFSPRSASSGLAQFEYHI